MRVQDVLRRLEIRGIESTRQSVARYEKRGLILEANRDNKGLRGKVAEYPEEAIHEFFASYMLMTGKFGDNLRKQLYLPIVGEIMPPIKPENKNLILLHSIRPYDVEKEKLIPIPPAFIAEARLLVICKEGISRSQSVNGLPDKDFLKIDFLRKSEEWNLFMDFLSFEWHYERERSRNWVE